MEEIKKLYKEHLEAKFPDLRGEEIHNIDLVLIDSDTAGLIDKYIHYRGKLSENDYLILNHCFSDLKKIIKELDGTDRQYFANLQNIAGLILNQIKSNKSEKIKDYKTDNKSNWETSFFHIRKILNEWDPLGVADSVDDEYDAINFSVLSVIVNKREKSEIKDIIKDYTNQNMGIFVSNETLDNLCDKISKVLSK